MAKKTPARQASSGGTAGGKAPGVSRKVLRSASAPYERKGEDGKGEDGKGEDPKQEASEAAAKPGEQSSKSEVAAEAPKSKPVEIASTIAVKAEAKPEAKAEAKPEAKAEAKPAAEPRPPALADDVAPGRSKASADASAEAPPAVRDAVPESEYAELLPPGAIGAWDPESPAPPPGQAPPGDSRSFRRYQDGVELFVLVYRHESFLITRAGKVGQQGKWTVVEYPTIGMAAHAYAQEGSRLTAEGYRDLR